MTIVTPGTSTAVLGVWTGGDLRRGFGLSHAIRLSTMHSIELARIATLISAQGPAVSIVRPKISSGPMNQYWVAARQRTELWNHGLGRLNELEEFGRPMMIAQWWEDHTPMIEEILISEILTRVMAATGATLDADVTDRDIEPVTESVFVSHLESRNRVLRILLFGRGRSVDQALRLNRLRRGVERWTDYLLGPLIQVRPEAVAYAIDPVRARTFADESSWGYDEGLGDTIGRLTTSAIAISLASLCDPRPALPQANRHVGDSVLACLRPELFDSLGIPHSAQTQRIRSSRSPEGEPTDRPGHSHWLFHSPKHRPPTPNLVRWTL
jgi:hypothetical protein